MPKSEYLEALLGRNIYVVNKPTGKGLKDRMMDVSTRRTGLGKRRKAPLQVSTLPRGLR